MRVHLVLIAIIGLVLLAGAGSAALTPDNNSSISTSANWTVVKDKTTITVQAMNGTTAIQGATVTVALSNSTLGSLSMGSTTTDTNGKVTGTFTAGTKSGSVNIIATITNGNSSITKTVTQYIDHATPYNVQFDYNIEVTVGTETPFRMILTDYYGNPIDNKNPADAGSPHTITLHIGCSASGTCAFDNSGNFVQDFTTSTDANGTATVAVRADSVSIENVIWMKAMGAITDQYKSIISVTDAPPASIVSEVTPPGMMQPSDGEANHTFTFKYTLYDKYGNTAANQSIIFHTTWPDDQDKQYTSNDQGLIWLTYGPHETAANITMTAIAVANSSVTVSDSVWFYSTAPVNMLLMASPQTMGSLDSSSAIRSNVSAEVIDIAGNPVSGETVTFSIGTPTYDATYNSTYTTAPAWEGTTSLTTTGVTDADGFAIVKFKPGSFDRNASDINYNAQATGHVPVTAIWTSGTTTVKKTLQLTWKNYPYLSVDTAVSPLTIALNDSVDLTIKLKGDGWALQPNPIDTVIVMDRSGSMGYTMGTSTKLKSAQNAAKTFVGLMNPGTDRIAVVSYAGSPGYPETSVDITPTTSYTSVNSTIDSWKANGATETRDGLKKAIDLLIANPNPNANAVKAIVLMTDGDYNWLGNPMGRGTGYDANYTSYSTSSLEPNKYLYYSGLGGTLVTPAPVAYFTASAGYSTRYQVKFTDGSSNSPTSYSWTFGDGGTSTSSSPTHTYSSTGTYTVTEKVTNGYGSNTSTRTATVGWSSSKSTVSLTPSMSAPSSSSSYGTCTDGQLTEQNMSIYAKDHNIRLYMITFSASESDLDSQAVTDMKVMANATGGYYSYAPDGTTLASIYTKIAGDLQTQAGVNTTMTAAFSNVNVSGVSFPGADVYKYRYVPNASTKIIWQDGNTNDTDQTADWNDDHNLNFNIGTITLGQTWQADMLFNMTKAGSVEVFNGSTIIFNNGTDSMSLPVKYVNVIPNLSNPGSYTGAIQVTSLVANPAGTKIVDSLPVNWNLTYTGNITKSATEQIYYSNDNKQSWHQVNTITGVAPCTDSPQSTTIDVRDKPAGTYYIRVIATAEDALGDQAVTSVNLGTDEMSYIKLE